MCVACSCDPLARATHVSTRTMVSPLGDVRLVLRVVADNAGEFRDWLEQELATWPFASLFPGLLARVLDIVLEWRRALPALAWRRLWRGNRILKEINEVMPAALQVVQWTDALADGTQAEVVDLCSGFGFLSMLLSHLLPASKVRGIWLVDKQWPHANREPLPHEISWEHVKGVAWPIPLATRKTDIKDGSDVRNLARCVFARATGPVLIAAVHLCGTLSIKAVQIFNEHPKCTALVLKPCCLPGRKHIFAQQVLAFRDKPGNAQRPHWQLGAHTFTAAELYADDEPPRSQQRSQRSSIAEELAADADASFPHPRPGVHAQPHAPSADKPGADHEAHTFDGGPQGSSDGDSMHADSGVLPPGSSDGSSMHADSGVPPRRWSYKLASLRITCYPWPSP